jgi:hypothetical protein
MQPELLQSERREAGAVALVADQDDSKVVSRDLGEPMRTRWIEPPLENVAVDHDGAGQVAITLPLLGGSSVDHEGSESLLSGEVRGPHALQPLPGTGQQVVDSPSSHGLKFCRRREHGPGHLPGAEIDLRNVLRNRAFDVTTKPDVLAQQVRVLYRPRKAPALGRTVKG